MGKYEFTSYPHSVFTSNGELLPAVDKSKLMDILEEYAKEDFSCSSSSDDLINANSLQQVQHARNCTVIDGMVVVQEMEKTK